MISSFDSSDSGICQNPLLASNLLKTAAPVSCTRVSSTLGMGCVSHRTLSFSAFRSTQILTAPDFLGTTTIPAHQGVGSFTFEITPISSMRSNSSWTLSRSGSGTFLGCVERVVSHLLSGESCIPPLEYLIRRILWEIWFSHPGVE